jgi:phage terminase large subunit
MEITLPYNWKPRKYQLPLWNYLSKGGKRAACNWHRRSGKDDVFLHHLACAAHERVGNFWYLLPEYAQARKSMWDAINGHTGKKRIDEAFPKELRKNTKEQEMMIHFHNGSTFQLVGSDNFSSLVGSPPVGLVFSEYAISNPSAWSYLRPILLENGGWAGFNSTPRGNNHFKNLCTLAESSEDWFYSKLTAEDTGVFTQEQLLAELREMQSEHGEDFGKSLWLQEYFCSFDAAIPGAIYAGWLDKLELAGRHTHVPHQKGIPVHTGWDLGRSDSTAIWFFQMILNEIHVIDYHESNLKDLDFYGDLLRGKVNSGDPSPLCELKSRTKTYRYGDHWLPSDARQRTLAAGGKSIHRQMIEQKVGNIRIAKRLNLMNEIQAARKTLPYCHFDRKNTDEGWEALRNYHYKWDEENRCYSNHPEHDWASHGSTAFATLALSWRVPHPEDPPVTREMEEKRILASSVGLQTFAQLRDKHLNQARRARNPF